MVTPTEASDFAASRLPPSFRVCGFTISISFMSDLKSYSEGNFAYFASLCQDITIRKGMPSPEKLVDSLIHELNHAVFHYYGIGKDDCEERIVSTMGRAWTQIFGDNPWLAGWIGETLNPSKTCDCAPDVNRCVADDRWCRLWRAMPDPRTAEFANHRRHVP